jgi:hypothetical protein
VNQEPMSLPSGTSRMSTIGSIPGRLASIGGSWGAIGAVFLIGWVGWIGFRLRGFVRSWDSRGDGDGKFSGGSVTLPRTFPDVDSCASFCFGFILVLRSFLPLPEELRPDLELEFLADPSLSLSLSLFFIFVLPAKGSAQVGVTLQQRVQTKLSFAILVLMN